MSEYVKALEKALQKACDQIDTAACFYEGAGLSTVAQGMRGRASQWRAVVKKTEPKSQLERDCEITGLYMMGST